MLYKFGFTLVELLLVIVLLAMIMSISFPRFSSTQKGLLLRQNAELIREFVTQAKHNAIVKNKNLALIINDSEKKIFISEFMEDDEEKVIVTTSSKLKTGYPDTILIKSTPPTIPFYTTGHSKPYKIEMSNGVNKIIFECEDFSGIPKRIEK